MNRFAVCTISTQSHLFKAKVVLGSVHRFMGAEVDLFCLLTDSAVLPQAAYGEQYHSLDFLQGDMASAIQQKYSGNRLRWACKPLYLLALLQQGYQGVMYVDNDICFYASPEFLFNRLQNGASVLLTPHHYKIDPYHETYWLEANYRVGLYNAGFVAASPAGQKALEWWAACCLYNVKKAAWRGLFDDQKYLDVMPVAFPGVVPVTHAGCNVAGWNIHRLGRHKDADGHVWMETGEPLVFVHYTPTTFRAIRQGQDEALRNHCAQYEAELKQFEPRYSVQAELKRTRTDYLLYFRHLLWLLTRKLE